MQIGGRSENFDWFENDDPLNAEILKRYNSTEPFWPSDESLKSVARGEKIILMDRAYVLSKSEHGVFGLPNDMFISSLQMICERGFPLLRLSSLIISQMNDAGIIKKLFDDFRYNATYLKEIRLHSQRVEDSLVVLKLSHLDGAFAVLILGLAISVICFFAEICVDNHNRHQKAQHHWQLIRQSLKLRSQLLDTRRRHIPTLYKELPNKNSAGARNRKNVDNRNVTIDRTTYEFRYLK